MDDKTANTSKKKRTAVQEYNDMLQKLLEIQQDDDKTKESSDANNSEQKPCETEEPSKYSGNSEELKKNLTNIQQAQSKFFQNLEQSLHKSDQEHVAEMENRKLKGKISELEKMIEYYQRLQRMDRREMNNRRRRNILLENKLAEAEELLETEAVFSRMLDAAPRLVNGIAQASRIWLYR